MIWSLNVLETEILIHPVSYSFFFNFIWQQDGIHVSSSDLMDSWIGLLKRQRKNATNLLCWDKNNFLSLK
jgi:hypothetical protein